jgi:hypothetical protein
MRNDDKTSRPVATGGVWAIRVTLLVATYALLWYGTRLLGEWDLRRRAEFAFRPWGLWAALAVFLLAGVVFAAAARFPFLRPRFAWGRIVIALLILVPPVHLTLWANGWSAPQWLFQPRWFDSIANAQTSALLAGVAIGCGFGARREASE